MCRKWVSRRALPSQRFAIRVCARSCSRMLVVYASRAQLDRSQASASVQKGIKEELKERGGDHAFPITDVRAVVRKAKQFSRERVEPMGERVPTCVRTCLHTSHHWYACAMPAAAHDEEASSGPSNTPCRGWCLGKATHRPPGPLYPSYQCPRVGTRRGAF